MIKDRLYELRMKRNLSQQGVSDGSGVVRETYTRYENGSRIPGTSSTLNEMLDAVNESKPVGEKLGFPKGNSDAHDMRDQIVPMLQLVLYLCSDEPDMPAIQHPQARMRASGAVDAPKEPRIWDVGVRIGAAIRRYDNTSRGNATDGDGAHASPRPHVRRAHWHHFWTGPLSGDRKLVLHWLPPIPVGTDWESENPVVIHPAQNEKQPPSQ